MRLAGKQAQCLKVYRVVIVWLIQLSLAEVEDRFIDACKAHLLELVPNEGQKLSIEAWALDTKTTRRLLLCRQMIPNIVLENFPMKKQSEMHKACFFCPVYTLFCLMKRKTSLVLLWLLACPIRLYHFDVLEVSIRVWISLVFLLNARNHLWP